MYGLKKYNSSIHVCRCGVTFEGATRSKYCPQCADAVKRIRNRLWYQGLAGYALQRSVAREYTRYLAALKDGTADKYVSRYSVTHLKHDESLTHPCPYCGKPVKSGIYCRQCVKAGLHWVNKYTGRTNGWDRKRRIA